jgi:hypothetical protein
VKLHFGGFPGGAAKICSSSSHESRSESVRGRGPGHSESEARWAPLESVPALPENDTLPHQCELCEWRFPNLNFLAYHIKAKHC